MTPLLLLALLAAPDAGAVPFVRTHWHHQTISVEYQGQTLHYEVGGEPDWSRPLFRQNAIGLDRLDQAKTVSLLEKAGVVYLLLHVEGPSRGPAGATGQCGGGTEGGLVLLAFNAHGEVHKPEIVVTDSCWLSIDKPGDDFAGPLDAHLVASLFYLDNQPRGDAGSADQDVVAHVAFDPDHPELGLQTDMRCRADGDEGGPLGPCR